MYTLYRYRGIHNHIVSSQSSFQSALFHPQTHGNLWQRYLRWFCKRPYWKFHASFTQLRFGYKLAAHKGVPAAPHRNDVGTRGHLCQGKTVDKNCPLCWFSVCVCVSAAHLVKLCQRVSVKLYVHTIKLDKIGNFCNKKIPTFLSFCKATIRPETTPSFSKAASLQFNSCWAGQQQHSLSQTSIKGSSKTHLWDAPRKPWLTSF